MGAVRQVGDGIAVLIDVTDEELDRVREVLGPECAAEGCGRDPEARGLCSLHYARARKAAELPPKEMEGLGLDPAVAEAAAELRAARKASARGVEGRRRGRGL